MLFNAGLRRHRKGRATGIGIGLQLIAHLQQHQLLYRHPRCLGHAAQFLQHVSAVTLHIFKTRRRRLQGPVARHLHSFIDALQGDGGKTANLIAPRLANLPPHIERCAPYFNFPIASLLHHNFLL